MDIDTHYQFIHLASEKIRISFYGNCYERGVGRTHFIAGLLDQS
jgi:hypothetical protein